MTPEQLVHGSAHVVVDLGIFVEVLTKRGDWS